MLNKIIRFVSLIFASTIVAFALVNMSPIDPVQQYVIGNGSISEEQKEKIAERWGVNDPPIQRYWKWLRSILQGDLGNSTVYRTPVIQVILVRMQNTLLLMSVSWILSGIIGYLLGCLMGLNEGRWLDQFLKKICLILSSVPTYWLGLVFLIIFAVNLKWFPIGFSNPIGLEASEVTLSQKLHHLILPALTLSLISFSPIALHTRQNIIQVYHSDYALFSYARGLSDWEIMRHHGIKNTIGPAFILQFSSFAELFGGSVLAENVFSYPGLGTAIATAGLKSDVPLLLGITIFSVVFVVMGNVIADVLNRKLDPRIGRDGA